jgi:hypothetical protein
LSSRYPDTFSTAVARIIFKGASQVNFQHAASSDARIDEIAVLFEQCERSQCLEYRDDCSKNVDPDTFDIGCGREL